MSCFPDIDLHAVNLRKASALINEYRLRYSILHFQVVLVDENNQIYPTDLQCQTEEIYEYEGVNILIVVTQKEVF